LAEVEHSAEALTRGTRAEVLDAMHASRCGWIRSLPAARRILDLGGSSQGGGLSALIEMGYRHEFDRLVIVDLPPAGGPGPDVERIADDSFDLVVCGQAFGRLLPREGEQALEQVFRVLQPGCFFALDTPNRAATAVQLRGHDAEVANPEHRVEYTHAQMSALFARHGFEVLIAQGLNYVPRSIATGEFDNHELINGALQHPDIDNCYMLAYLARKPRSQGHQT
jgi:SAM-dependent methyltransferase